MNYELSIKRTFKFSLISHRIQPDYGSNSAWLRFEFSLISMRMNNEPYKSWNSKLSNSQIWSQWRSNSWPIGPEWVWIRSTDGVNRSRVNWRHWDCSPRPGCCRLWWWSISRRDFVSMCDFISLYFTLSPRSPPEFTNAAAKCRTFAIASEMQQRVEGWARSPIIIIFNS